MKMTVGEVVALRSRCDIAVHMHRVPVWCRGPGGRHRWRSGGPGHSVSAQRGGASGACVPVCLLASPAPPAAFIDSLDLLWMLTASG